MRKLSNLKSKIHMIGIGLGVKEHLTFGAYEQLKNSDYIYVMARPGSWMIQFVQDIAGQDKVRPYMPENVRWNSGWQSDPIFTSIADEVHSLVTQQKHVCFAMAGDVAIYGNIADSIVPLLRERGLAWDVYPGVSFLNGLSILTGEPIVGECDNLAVTFAQTSEDVDTAFEAANVVVLYNPGGFNELRGYISQRKMDYARMVVVGVYGKAGKIVDLLKDHESKIQGLVIFKRAASNQIAISKQKLDSSPGIKHFEHHMGTNGWDSSNRFFAACYPNRLMCSEQGKPGEATTRYTFPERPEDIRGFFIDSHDHIYVGLKGFKTGSFGRTYVSRDAGKSFETAFEQCFWGMDQDTSGNLFAGVYHERNEPDCTCSVLWSADQGKTWTDIADPKWKSQLHVHHVAVDPHTGWLYANLGDKQGLRGCWRSKVQVFQLSEPIPAGSLKLPLMSLKNIGLIPGDVLISSNGQRLEIAENHKSYVTITHSLRYEIPTGCALMKLDWQLKFANQKNTLQFIGMAFKDKYIYLSALSRKFGDVFYIKQQSVFFLDLFLFGAALTILCSCLPS